jgi:acyl carrier protein phosphodiesterase
VYRVLSSERQLPERLAKIAPHMVANDWLGSYREFEVLEQVLRGISRRLTRPEELAAAMQELRVLYEPLSEDFRCSIRSFRILRRAIRQHRSLWELACQR